MPEQFHSPEQAEAARPPQHAEDEAHGKTRPINENRVFEDVQKALNRLEYLSQDSSEEMVKDLQTKLNALNEKSQQIDLTNADALRSLREELYAECQPFLKKAAEQQLKTGKSVANSSFQSDGLHCSLNGVSAVADLTELYDVRSLQIQGATLHFETPVSLSALDQVVGPNATRALNIIGKRFPTEGLQIRASSARFEFSVQEQGRQVEYVATSHDVLQVVSTPSTEARQQWKDAQEEKRKAEDRADKALLKMRDLLKGKDSQTEKAISNYMNWGVESQIKDVDVSKLTSEQKEQWDTCIALKKESRSAGSAEAASQWECCRILESKNADGKTVRVREFIDPADMSNFELLYSTQGGETFMYWSSGSLTQKSEYEKGKKVRESIFRESVDHPSIVRDFTSNTLDQYDEKGTKLYRKTFNPASPAEILETRMYDSAGNAFGTLNIERQAQPGLTPDAYLDMLAKKLDTPAKIEIFTEQYMQYVHDSSDPQNPLKKGTKNDNGEYWQTAQETIQRLEDGKMLGDCEDWAFLAKEILCRQGKAAFVVNLKNHAECFWAEKDVRGRWHGYSMGTFGLDHNGHRRSEAETPQANEGFATLEEAISSLLKKYKHGGLGAEAGTDISISHNTIGVMHTDGKGLRLDRSIPLFAFDASSPMSEEYRTAVRLEDARDFDGAERKYAKLSQKYPNEIAFLKNLEKLYTRTLPFPWDKLAPVYERMTMLDRENPEPYAMAGIGYSRKNDKKAVEFCKQALQKGSDNVGVLKMLGLLLTQEKSGKKIYNDILKKTCTDWERKVGNSGGIEEKTLDFMESLYRESGQPERIIPYRERRILTIKSAYGSKNTADEAKPKLKAAWRNHVVQQSTAYTQSGQYEKQLRLCEDYLESCGRDDRIEELWKTATARVQKQKGTPMKALSIPRRKKA